MNETNVAFKVIYILFMFIGLSMLVIWTRDIVSNPLIDLSKGIFKVRDDDSGNLFWPHWMAEYATAALLVFSPVLIFLNVDAGWSMLPFAAGALAYTTLNSLGWTFASKERYPYIVPMAFSLLVSLVYLILLIIH